MIIFYVLTNDLVRYVRYLRYVNIVAGERSIVSAYPMGKWREFMYVCINVDEVKVVCKDRTR